MANKKLNFWEIIYLVIIGLLLIVFITSVVLALISSFDEALKWSIEKELYRRFNRHIMIRIYGYLGSTLSAVTLATLLIYKEKRVKGEIVSK